MAYLSHKLDKSSMLGDEVLFPILLIFSKLFDKKKKFINLATCHVFLSLKSGEEKPSLYNAPLNVDTTLVLYLLEKPMCNGTPRRELVSIYKNYIIYREV